MLFSKTIADHILSYLSEITGKAVLLKKTSSLSGGSINEAHCLETTAGKFFVKLNSSLKFPGMFEAEERGLALLRSSATIGIPNVLKTGDIENTTFFIAEFLESAGRISTFSRELGKSLAILHKNTSKQFGLDHDNYIGALTQSNRQHKSWIDFFIEERLEKQVQLARDNGRIDASTQRGFNNLYKRIESIFPMEAPSLLHGDLWNGNYVTGPDGKAWLIDPAVYYGFREMDIAMSKLFGGFEKEFYEAYQEEFSMKKGWQERMDICNLYPLMVHVNLFGGGYLSDVQAIVRRF